MEDHDPNSPRQGSEKSEPVRSRWTPKPEQILILESIFNSGMVNPPKDETVRIRKLLEKFGTVGDANVFYWFQNRRSRSRRRQRQLQQQQQATLNQQRNHQPPPPPPHHHHQVVENGAIASAISYDQTQTTPSVGAMNMGFVSSSSYNFPHGSSSSSCGVVQQGGMDGFFSVSSQMGYPGIDHTSAASSSSSVLYPPLAPNLNYHSGYGGANASAFITVFINGIATELQGGPIDIKTVFGEDVMLVHSSGVPVPTNEFGFLMQSLQHGESYFLVSKATQVA